jgi:hypothetical protein
LIDLDETSGILMNPLHLDREELVPAPIVIISEVRNDAAQLDDGVRELRIYP